MVKLANGIEYFNPPVVWTRETKLSHAVWAAGQGLTPLLLPNFDMVDNTWLEPLSLEGIGCTKITKHEDEGSGVRLLTRFLTWKRSLYFVLDHMLLPKCCFLFVKKPLSPCQN